VTPTLEEIEMTHLHIKELIAKYNGGEVAATVPIIYGGSVQRENIFQIYSQRSVDGIGFGGCSLDFQCFSAAIKNVTSATSAS